MDRSKNMDLSAQAMEEFLRDMDDYSSRSLVDTFKKRHAGMGAPDPSPAHEAMETPAEEALEHATGMEAQDEPRR